MTSDPPLQRGITGSRIRPIPHQAIAGLLLAAGCLDSAMLAPNARSVQLRVTAQVQGALGEGEQILIEVGYLRDGAAAPIALGEERIVRQPGEQRVPMVVDLTPCLNDGARADGDGCPLVVTLTLEDASGATLDRATVGPVNAAPAAVVEVPPAVLSEVASVNVALSRSDLLVGEAASASASAARATGHAVANPQVAWSSSNTAVATVDGAGAIVTHRQGTATIRASAGKATGEATLEVREWPLTGIFAGLSRHEGSGYTWSITMRMVQRGVVLNGQLTTVDITGAATGGTAPFQVPASPGPSFTLSGPTSTGRPSTTTFTLDGDRLTGVQLVDEEGEAVSRWIWDLVRVPTRAGCEREGTLRSIDGNVPATLRFRNATAEAVRIYWLNYAGQREPYAELPPAAPSYDQPTYLTHLWMAIGASGRCYGIFSAMGDHDEVVIE